jgi:hypothetical protein
MSIREKALRVVLFLTAAIHLGAWAAAAGEGAAPSAATIQACNRGYPFHYYAGAPDDPRTDAGQLHPYAANFGDYGIGFLLSAQAAVTQSLTGTPARLGAADEARLCFLVLLVTALAACLPPAPLPLSAGATLGLHLLVPVVCLDYASPAGCVRIWGALTVFQAALFLALGLQPRKGLIAWAGLMVLGLMIAFAPIVRQASAGIPLGMLLALGFAGGASCLACLVPPGGDRRGAWHVLRGPAARAAVLLLLLGGELVAVRYAVLAVYSRAYHIPLARLEMPRHGAGFPLYLSLGTVSNPYNIGWEDEIAVIHGQLASGRPLPYCWELQEQLVKEWARLVREAPDLFCANVLARARQLATYALVSAPGTRENQMWREDNPWRARCLPWLFGAALLALGAALARFVRRPGFLLGLYLAGALGAVLGANASALLIYAGYPWDTCGALIALACVVLPASWCLAARRAGAPDPGPAGALERALVRRLAAGLAALLVVGLAAGGAWAGYRHFRNARLAEQVAARPRPLAEIRARGYRYAALFNRMSERSQEQVLQALRGPDCPGVFDFTTGEGRQDIFRPELGVVADGILYLVCRFNDGWRPPAPCFDDGAVNSYVHVVRDDAAVLGRWPFRMDDGVSGFHRINDRFWENRYRMLCLPCGPGFQPRETIRVGSFTIVGLTPQGWDLEAVASGTLSRPPGRPETAP